MPNLGLKLGLGALLGRAGGSTPAYQFSQRSSVNIGVVNPATDFRFINHFMCGESPGPSGSSWSTGSVWMQSIGPTGAPNIQFTSGRDWAAGLRLPAGWQYGAPGSGHYYVLKFKGSGTFRFFLGTGTVALVSGTNVTTVNAGNGTFKTTPGTVDTYMVFSYDGPAQLFSLIFQTNDPDGVGANGYVRNIALYRQDDETDFLAGKIFRAPYKQTLVDMCPSSLRFMDWIGGNNAKLTRFDTSRQVPGMEYISRNWNCSPAYGETTGTNQYVLAAATGTAGNPQTTPATHVHGELVTCRMGATMVRAGSKTITAGASGITKANPGVVNCSSHGFNTGDVIRHEISTGMTQLDQVPVTITVIDANSYSVGIDTTSFSTFTSGKANQYITLNVGGRGDYPVLFPDATTIASNYSNGYITAGDYKSFIFDKTLSAKKDTSGNLTYGVWMFNDSGSSNGHAGGVPLEYCVALVNEVNDMGPAKKVGMWLNMPHLGTSSMDNYAATPPFAYTTGAGDYTSAANWGVNAVNVVLNGANGFPGLKYNVPLFVEYSNETWNSANSNFSQTFYLARRGQLRWSASGSSDYSSMVALRSTIMVEDIKAMPGFDPNRVKFVLAGQGALGVSGLNQSRIDGLTYFLNDPLNVAGPSVAPMKHHDYFAFASYLAPSGTFDTSNLASLTSSWIANAGNPTAQEANCASYVAGIVSSTGGQTVNLFQGTLLPQFVSKMAAYGKATINYEGGWDKTVTAIFGSTAQQYGWGVQTSGTNTITGVPSSYITAVAAVLGSDTVFIYGNGIPDGTTVASAASGTLTLSNNATVSLTWGAFLCYSSQNAFLRAVKRSQAWSDTWISYMNAYNQANAGMPTLYVELDVRWGHTYPSAYGYKTTEWGDLDLLWQNAGSRNRALT